MKILQTILMTIVMFCWFGLWIILGIVVEAEAKDFGTQGHVFTILEEDFLEVINARLQKIDWEKFNQETQTRTKEYVERPTSVAGITRAQESKEFFYDPTYVLIQDIRDHNHQLLHSAGTKLNPLEFTPLREDLLFIDGDDDSQVKFALKQQAKIILVKGSPLKLQRKEKIWIYFDQGGVLTSKLGITQVPALVTQEGLQLKIKIFGGNL
ncbi:MAG: type-F conjugative transfer system protein TraW [Candidatus Poribacteria bacterium]